MARSGRSSPPDLTADLAATEGLRVALVVARFNEGITERLARGAHQALRRLGLPESAVERLGVPGAWELPLGVERAREAGADAAVALGCVIRGETPHFEYVCRGATRGLMTCQLARGGYPVGYGLLTCDDREQALARAGGERGNKGAEAAEATVEMLLTGRVASPAAPGEGP